MIDFETDLRDRFDRAAAVTPSPDLLATVERRIVTRGRRTTALRVAGAVAVVALASGIAVAATGGDGADTDPTVATDPPATTEGGTTTTAPPAAEPGWAEMADAPIAPRSYHLTLAMDDEILVWGGMELEPNEPDADGDAIPTMPVDGAVYDPVADSWRTIPDAPLPGSASGVWTGTEAILVSGGPPLTTPDMAGGPPEAAAFDPATDTWRTLAAPPEDLAPTGITTVWTGTHVVALQSGTAFPEDDPVPTAVGVYDPATDTWTTGATTDALSPTATAVWTGTEVLVVASANTDPSDGTYDEMLLRAYDPAADTWRSIPWGLEGGDRSFPVVAWTGDRLFVAGGLTYGDDPEGRAQDAALLDPVTGTWTPTARPPAAVFGPDEGASPWTGEQVVALSAGQHPLAPSDPSPVLAYDLATDTWSEGPVRPGPAVERSTAVWAAGRVVVPLGATPPPMGEDGTSGCCAIPVPGGATYTP